MRVLLLTETCQLGGAEVMIRNLALELRARGHAVGLVAPSNGGDWLHGEMKRDGFPVWLFELRGAVNPDIVQTIRRAIAAFRTAVMHSHLWVMAAYGGAVASLARIPHVITMHGDGEQTRFLRRRVALRFAFARARGVVAVSAAMRDDLAQSLGIPASRMLVVPNGSSFPKGDRTLVRRELSIGADEFVAVCIGSQIARKNHIVALQAMARLSGEAPWRLLVAGPTGDATATLADAARRLGVSAHFHNLGPRRDVPDLLAASDVYLMPSLWEGMPVALVEAMGSGVPIVASGVGGIPDMIGDGLEGAILSDPTNAGDLAGIIERLRGDDTLRHGIAARARQKALAVYGAAAMADAYLDLFQGKLDTHEHTTSLRAS